MEHTRISPELDDVDEPFDPRDFYLGLHQPETLPGLTPPDGHSDEEDDLFGDRVGLMILNRKEIC